MLLTVLLLTLAQTPPPLVAPSDAPVEQQRPSASGETSSTLFDAQTRLSLLKQEGPPSLGAPIALLVTGVALFGVSVVFAYLGLSLLPFFQVMGTLPVALTFLIIGGAALIPAVILAVAGAVTLKNTLRARRERSSEIRRLEEQLRGVPNAPPPTTAPSSVSVPAPPLLLATF